MTGAILSERRRLDMVDLLAKRPELETIAQAGAIIAADAVMSA